jgi:hypothetical protein
MLFHCAARAADLVHLGQLKTAHAMLVDHDDCQYRIGLR